MKPRRERQNRKRPPSNPTIPKTAEQFFAMPVRVQRIYRRVVNLIPLLKQGQSLTRAMRESRLTRAQVNRFGRSAFRKLNNGRWAPKAYDHLLRVVMVISNDGLQEVATLDSRQASKAGK